MERSSTDMVEGILDGMRWIRTRSGTKVRGRRSLRAVSSGRNGWPATATMAGGLVAAGKAHLLLHGMNSSNGAALRRLPDPAWRYDRYCCALDADTRARYEREQRPRAIRSSLRQVSHARTTRCTVRSSSTPRTSFR